MRRKPINIGKEKWDYKAVDKDALKKQVKRARHYLSQIEVNAQRGSILVDLDYGEVFDAVENIYNIVGIGELAADNAKRKEVEDKELREKGLKQ